MPNGGLPNCLPCKYSCDNKCSIHGTPVSSSFICKMFADHLHSNEYILENAPFVKELKPGYIYQIDNTYPTETIKPVAVYKMISVFDLLK